MMFVIYLLVLLCVTVLIKYNLDKQRLLKYVAHLPGPKAYPFIGNALNLIGKTNKEIFKTLLEITRMQSSTVAWLGTQLFVVLNDPEDVKSVLMSPNCLDKPYLYRLFPFKGILTSEVHVWKSSRKLISPTFSMKILLSHIPIFNEKSKSLLNQLKHRMQEKNFDLSKYIFACTLDATCATFMGFESETLLDKNKEFLEAMERVFAIASTRVMKFWLHPSLIYNFTRSYQDETRLLGEILRITNMAKSAKLDKFLKNKNNTNNQPPEGKYEVPLFLDSLFELVTDGKLTDDESTDNIMTMLFAGSETTALTIAHTIFMLAVHPKYQERVLEELESTCNSVDGSITYETISKLQYLEMVIKETMRLFPLAPLLGRNCLADTKISSCTIPKGTFIGIVVHHLHRNPEVWGTDSDEFNPDHFLPDRIADRHPFQYLPFSAGSRNCIGMRYGWMLMKVVLAHLLLNFKFSTNLKMEQVGFRWQGILKLNKLHTIKTEKRI